MTIKELSKNAYDELLRTREHLVQLSKDAVDDRWRAEVNGKIKGIDLVLGLMTDKENAEDENFN